MPSESDLTDTTSRDEFHLVRPNDSVVTFAFNRDPARPGMTRLTVPRGSKWSADPHWHESYTEYLVVIQGRARVVIDGISKIVTKEDGPQTVEKFAIHEWLRADRDTDEKDDEDVIVEEWTDPGDGLKQVFFRNLLSILEDRQRYWRSWMMPQILLILSVYDNYSLITPPSLPKWVAYSATHIAFGMVKPLALILRLRPWYEAYTPVGLRSIAIDVYEGKSTTKRE